MNVHSTAPMKTLLVLAGFSSLVLAAPNSGTVGSAYVGSKTCEECHKQGYRRFAETKMAKVFFDAPRSELEAKGCEACHGPGSAHVEKAREHDRARAAGVTYTGERSGAYIDGFGEGSALSVGEQDARCLQCHEKGQRMFWMGSTHESRGLSCITCHQVHQKALDTVAAARFKEPLSTNNRFVKSTQMEVCFNCHPMRRVQLERSSHMPLREGAMTCTNCHNPHGGPNPKMLVKATVNETCYQCHPERRGPFLWEHPPVMENCLNCHDPHGSTRPQLLKVNPPRLCQECHDSTGHPGTPQAPTVRYVFNRGCTNCHSQIHGSNHPSGSRFQR